jgi:hypothetical protein
MASQRPRKIRNSLYLQPRDVAMLLSVETARYLTIPALEWLHFPQWRARYKRHIAQGGTPATYQPDSNLYHRLKLLAEGGMLHRIDLAPSRVNPVGTAPAPRCTVYALACKGADLITEHRGSDDVRYDRVSLYPSNRGAWAADRAMLRGTSGKDRDERDLHLYKLAALARPQLGGRRARDVDMAAHQGR